MHRSSSDFKLWLYEWSIPLTELLISVIPAVSDPARYMSLKLQILLNFRENVSWKSTGNHTCWSVRHPGAGPKYPTSSYPKQLKHIILILNHGYLTYLTLSPHPNLVLILGSKLVSIAQLFLCLRTGGILFRLCPLMSESVHPGNLVNTISQKPIKGILRNLVTDVFRFIDVLIRFFGHNVEVQGHSRQRRNCRW